MHIKKKTFKTVSFFVCCYAAQATAHVHIVLRPESVIVTLVRCGAVLWHPSLPGPCCWCWSPVIAGLLGWLKSQTTRGKTAATEAFYTHTGICLTAPSEQPAPAYCLSAPSPHAHTHTHTPNHPNHHLPCHDQCCQRPPQQVPSPPKPTSHCSPRFTAPVKLIHGDE